MRIPTIGGLVFLLATANPLGAEPEDDAPPAEEATRNEGAVDDVEAKRREHAEKAARANLERKKEAARAASAEDDAPSE